MSAALSISWENAKKKKKDWSKWIYVDNEHFKYFDNKKEIFTISLADSNFIGKLPSFSNQLYWKPCIFRLETFNIFKYPLTLVNLFCYYKTIYSKIRQLYLIYMFHNVFISVKPREVSNLHDSWTGHSTTIIWDQSKFEDYDTGLEYIIEMYRSHTKIFFGKTQTNYFYCHTECKNATSFKIWTVLHSTKSKSRHRFFNILEGNYCVFFSCHIFRLKWI